jgi:hypothetical protein
MSGILSTRLQYSMMMNFFPVLLQYVTTYDKNLVLQVRAKIQLFIAAGCAMKLVAVT